MGQVCPAVATQLGRPTENGPSSLSNGTTASAPPQKTGDEKLLDKYTLGKVLGQGAFGVVYACKSKATREEFAVKMIDQVETPVSEIKQEVDMLRKLAHPCVVKLHDVYYEKVFVCMVLEIYKGGDMIEGMQLHWKSKGMIPVPVVQNMSKMMFQGIDWLHSKDVIHRDLKGDNYLQDRKDLEHPSCRVYLSDFGTVMNLGPNDRLRQKCGTKTYWAPEFYALNYGIKVDIWALGVVIFGMVTGRFPFKGEEDARNKPVKVPTRCGKDGETFLLGTLEKDEAKRLSAKQALQHPFLASIKSSAETQEPWDTDFKPEVKEVGANAGVAERRKELVERLENAANKKGNSFQSDLFQSAEKLKPSFTVQDKRAEKSCKFEWFSVEQYKAANFLDEAKAKAVSAEEDTSKSKSSEQSIRTTLEDHSISTSEFGQGSAKTFTEFASEVQGGQARLMLDASKHKNVVRAVDIVLLRITHGSGEDKRYLVKTAEKYPDGRMRTDINQLVGTKKLPFENGKQTTARLMKDRMKMEDVGLSFDYTHVECFEDDEDSPSYPGVRTVYRKEIYEGVLQTTDNAALERVGLTNVDKSYETSDDKQYTHYYKWMTDAECQANKVKLRAPEEGSDVSTLVFPPIGLNEEELQKFLVESKVDTEQFGKDGVKTLQEFSDELVKGEAQLVQQEDGSIIRLVDVLILKLANKEGGILVEAGQETAGIPAKDFKPRLPAVKRRADENMFWAAHRVLRKVLKVHENLVELDPNSVLLVEEQSASKNYGAVPTLYRRQIVSAKLLEG